jgi:hypothetical protein
MWRSHECPKDEGNIRCEGELLREGHWRCEGELLREGHWRCEGPADEGCKQRGSLTFRDEAFLFLYESDSF